MTGAPPGEACARALARREFTWFQAAEFAATWQHAGDPFAPCRSEAFTNYHWIIRGLVRAFIADHPGVQAVASEINRPDPVSHRWSFRLLGYAADQGLSRGRDWLGDWQHQDWRHRLKGMRRTSAAFARYQAAEGWRDARLAQAMVLADLVVLTRFVALMGSALEHRLPPGSPRLYLTARDSDQVVRVDTAGE